MSNPGSDNQFELFRQMAQRTGITGTAYIDCNAADGFFRVKLKVMPVEQQGMLTSSFAQVLAQTIQMFGLQVKTHQTSKNP
jgi:hypothetical protein